MRPPEPDPVRWHRQPISPTVRLTALQPAGGGGRSTVIGAPTGRRKLTTVSVTVAVSLRVRLTSSGPNSRKVWPGPKVRERQPLARCRVSWPLLTVTRAGPGWTCQPVLPPGWKVTCTVATSTGPRVCSLMPATRTWPAWPMVPRASSSAVTPEGGVAAAWSRGRAVRAAARARARTATAAARRGGRRVSWCMAPPCGDLSEASCGRRPRPERTGSEPCRTRDASNGLRSITRWDP
jgi:hypothetical protein